jgi:hypothetical protein
MDAQNPWLLKVLPASQSPIKQCYYDEKNSVILAKNN